MVDYIRTKYPLVFVHGMFGWGENEGINKYLPYWGVTSGSLKEYLTDNEIECYEASVGPMSSVWDQACELYAQLKGTRVDYGELHSRKYGHRRYGRTYSNPLFSEWDKDKKIHLIGHSFGGNTARMLVHLLKYGAPEEVEMSGDEVSPLFLGGQDELVCSVTAICSPLDGTDAYETARRYRIVSPLKFFCFNYAGLLSHTRLQGKFVDFHLEQFGVNDTPGKKDKKRFMNSVKSLFESTDNIEYDMSRKGADDFNKIIKTVPSVYYFSYYYNSVEKAENGKLHPENANFLLLKATCALILRNNRKSGKTPVGNDGLVDVTSAMYPHNERYKLYEKNERIEKGIWNVMPERKGDHGTPIGLFSDKYTARSFYDDMVYLLSSAEYSC